MNNQNKWLSRLVFAMAILYGYMETHLFGYHFYPSCGEEAICDGIGIIICVLGLILGNMK